MARSFVEFLEQIKLAQAQVQFPVSKRQADEFFDPDCPPSSLKDSPPSDLIAPDLLPPIAVRLRSFPTRNRHNGSSIDNRSIGSPQKLLFDFGPDYLPEEERFIKISDQIYQHLVTKILCWGQEVSRQSPWKYLAAPKSIPTDLIFGLLPRKLHQENQQLHSGSSQLHAFYKPGYYIHHAMLSPAPGSYLAPELELYVITSGRKQQQITALRFEQEYDSFYLSPWTGIQHRTGLTKLPQVQPADILRAKYISGQPIPFENLKDINAALISSFFPDAVVS